MRRDGWSRRLIETCVYQTSAVNCTLQNITFLIAFIVFDADQMINEYLIYISKNTARGLSMMCC